MANVLTRQMICKKMEKFSLIKVITNTTIVRMFKIVLIFV